MKRDYILDGQTTFEKHGDKRFPGREFVFEPPPSEAPHGKVEVDLMNLAPEGKQDIILRLVGTGLYTETFNRLPIRYYIAGADVRHKEHGILSAKWLPASEFTADQKARAMALVLGQ